MSLTQKILIGTAVGALVTGAAVYASRMNKTSNEMVIIPTVNVHKLSAQGLSLRVDIQLKNPTRSSIRLNYPFIKMIHAGSVLGSSAVIDKEILIPGFGQAVVQGIMIDIPLLNLLSLSGDLLKALNEGKSIKLNVRTLTQLNLGWKKFPYEDNQIITLNKQKA